MIRLTGYSHLLKNEKLFQRMQLFALFLLPWALFLSEAVTSILVIIFSVPLLFFGREINGRQSFQQMWPFFMFYSLMFLSGFWSADTGRWMSLLRVNLPYLMMPLAFSLWPSFLLQFSKKILSQFFLAGSVISMYIFYLALSGKGVGAEIASGGFLPVPVHHVRTSLFLVVAVIAGWDRLGEKGTGKYGWNLWMMLILLSGIHLLAVRTGIVLVYVSSLIYFLTHKNFRGRSGWLWLGVMMIVFWIVFFTSPTLSEKWNYWKEDWQNFSSHSWSYYSDAMRWKTNVVGWNIAAENFWWGVGMGDVRDEMTLKFLQEEGVYSEHYPHNLWIAMMAGTGMLGLVLTNISLGVLGFRQWRSGPVWFALFVTFMGSCIVETTLLSSLGTIGFVLVALLAGQNYSFRDSGISDLSENRVSSF